MLSLIEKNSLAKIKSKIKANKTFFTLPIKITIKKAIMPLIIPNILKQKTSYTLKNLYINNC